MRPELVVALDEGAMIGDRGVAPPFYLLLALPQGTMQEFVGVTLGFVLVHHGVSVAAVAGLAGISILPSTLQFVAGPLVDVTMTPKRWYVAAVALVCASFIALGAVPPTPADVLLLTVLTLFAGIALALVSTCFGPLVGRTASCEQRGVISGWQQAGNLGGAGLGGGAGLWVATEWSMPVAGVTLAIGCAVAALPITHLRTARAASGETLRDRAAATLASVKDLLHAHSGRLAVVFNVMPIGLGVAASLFAAIAIDWHASAALVGVVTGVAGSVASALGCVAGGVVAGRMGAPITMLAAGLGFAAAEVAMVLAPHTPFWFAAFVVAANLLLGGGWAALKAVIYDQLGAAGGGTVNGILTSLANVPVVAFTALLGLVQAGYGSDGLLIAEASLDVAAISVLALLLRLWRAPDRRTATLRPV